MKINKIVVTLFLLTSMVFANANLYVFVFKDGVALKNTTIELGSHATTTNEYGYAQFLDVDADTYEISYLKDGKPFALENINLVNDQDSQVFLNLVNDKAKVELDLPLEAYNQDFKKVEVKKLEGPKGSLEFKLFDSKSKEVVKKAKLFFKGYQLEANSDANGIVKLNIPEGTYDISIIHPNYVMKVLKDIKIKKEKTTIQEVALTKSDIALEEYVVLAPAVEGSLASTFAELKDSDVVGDALSAEQFSKSGDSSAASALKRVTGVTIVGGKYVYVRGLGERYSTILLNNMYVPSPEPTKRVVPLDIFPTDVIQSMNIQKSWSADLPGTFGGGDVVINTKDIPREDNYIKGSLSLTYNDATGKSGLYNSDNTKAFPSRLISMSENFANLQEGLTIGNQVIVEGYTSEELAELRKSMANYRTYGFSKKTIEPGKKIALSTGQRFKTANGLEYGVAGSVYYKTSEDIKKYTKNSFTILNDNSYSVGEKNEIQETQLSEKYGGIVSLGIQNDAHKLKYSFIPLVEKVDKTGLNNKDGGQEGPSIDDSLKYYVGYEERELLLHQLNGEHTISFAKTSDKLFDDLSIKWGYSFGEATNKKPSEIEYLYEKTANTTDYYLDQDIWYLYTDLKDNVTNARVDLSLPYTNNDRDNYLTLGVFNYTKTREFDSRRFRFRHDLGNTYDDTIDEALSDDSKWTLTDNYKAADAYSAKQSENAFYLKSLYSITENLDFLVGARNEQSTQKLTIVNPSTDEEIKYNLDSNDLLPYGGLTYRINDEHQLRFSYSKTLSAPDFREFSPNRYKDPATDDIVFGYPYLKTTFIDSIDMKYEWYPSFDEAISFALFQKEFTNPIEKVNIADSDSQDGNDIVSYRNAKSAQSTGFEIGVRKKFNFISEDLQNYFASVNYAQINSKIKLDKNEIEPEGQTRIIQNLTTSSRAMQGQSPTVTNIQIGYDNVFTGRSAILLYNSFGKRIDSLGSYGDPDKYEQAYKKLDFVVKWQLNDTYDLNEHKIGYTVAFKANNLLDSTKKVTQGGLLIEEEKPGRSFNISFSVKY